ncbi:3333_t:CDS:2 [Paraglomus occultum]|uniref:3333_t:CDS:1 n=1 Tax=Paraglomus occultum TaxID=144539 RepID=A0A9N9CBC0_9GLOM|nr:3333_t:CDS:2 [Paraglomus occultum]
MVQTQVEAEAHGLHYNIMTKWYTLHKLHNYTWKLVVRLLEMRILFSSHSVQRNLIHEDICLRRYIHVEAEMTFITFDDLLETVEDMTCDVDYNITKDDGTFYKFGEDIPEAPERAIIDSIGPRLLVSIPR